MHKKNITINKVRLDPIGRGDTISDEVCYKCCFCEKIICLDEHHRNLCETLSSSKEIFCPFCLRYGFSSKNRRNVFILTFRSIVGYYYHVFYKHPQHRKMFIPQINDYIGEHETAGLANPVFSYDRESMLWFIDFNRVGRGKNKLPFQTIETTLVDILACFQLKKYGLNADAFQNNCHSAVWKFYTERKQPPHRILSPTLDDSRLPTDLVINFTRKNLVRRA